MARRDELGPFEREVLEAVIAKGRDAYGVTIMQNLEQRSGRRVSLGALYTTLERLERKGLIRSWWGESTAVRGGRRKRLYAIQAAGTRALVGAELQLGSTPIAAANALPRGA